MPITYGKGVDIIFEQGGPKTLPKRFACMTWGGLISCVGHLSGEVDEAGGVLNTNVLALRRKVTFKGIWNGPSDHFREALELYEYKQIHPGVDKVYRFDEARETFECLGAGNPCRKVVIKFKGGSVSLWRQNVVGGSAWPMSRSVAILLCLRQGRKDVKGC